MSRPQDDRNQEATVYLVCNQIESVSAHAYTLCLGKPGRALHRRACLGVNAPGRSSWYVLHSHSYMLRWFSCPTPDNEHLPKDRISMAHQGYGFCEFLTEEDAEYACKIMNQIKLWGKPIRVNKVRTFSYVDMVPPDNLLCGIMISRCILTYVSSSDRPLRIKNNWTLAPTSSSEIWMKTLTNAYYTTHSVRLV
jgi:hypothetical protein